MYYHLIYHIQNAVEQESSNDDKEQSYNWFNNHLAYNLTSGGLRKFSQDINFAVVRDDYHGFEVIVAYPDFLTPGYPVLFSIIQEQEAMFDIKFYEKPVCFDNLHLRQISTCEFLMRLSQSTNPLMNVLTLMNEHHVKHYDGMESKYKAALDELNKQEEVQETEKEPHVL